MGEPEVTLSSERTFVGKRIFGRADRVRLTDGSEATRYFVEVPDAVVILPVDDSGNVLLVRQYRPAIGAELLELPAGQVEPGEQLLEAAQRELREETGFAASELVELGSFYPGPGTISECLFAFLATGLVEDSLPADDDELIEVERVALTELLASARAGEVHDGKTLASLLLAERRLLG